MAARHWLAGDFANDYLTGFDACLDLPTPVYFRELDNAYPGSRFILTVREENQWLESIDNILKGSPAHGQETQLRDMIRVATYGTFYFHKERYRRIFNDHNDAVRAYFRNRPESLLVMDITAGDGWGKLSPFLGNTVISERPFPNLRSPYLGSCASVSHDEIETKGKLLEKMLCVPNAENNHD